MFKTLLLSLPVISATAMSATAGDTLPLTYEAFEASVTHLDLDTCPEALAAKDVFCRLAIGSDELHVFAFSENEDQSLVGFASYDEDAYALTFK